MLNIALFGPPGAGKGTQSKLLIEKYNLAYISTGDILRNEIAHDTPLGREAKSVIEKGGLVSDDIIVRIIETNIKKNSDVNGFLFDGFPRTTVQAYILEGLLSKMNSSLSCMISLEVPKNLLRERMLQRAKDSNRSDDTEAVIEKRLQEYEDKTIPVIDFYKDKGVYYPIDGVQQIEDVHDAIQEVVHDANKKSKFNIVLLGPPGSGKAVQGQELAKRYNLAYISTGALLRKEIKNKTEIGKSVRSYVEKGDIVPDEIAIKLIEEEIKKNPEAHGFIFKGFPRTLVQAYILDGLLRKQGSKISTIINLTIPTLESLKRLRERGTCDDQKPDSCMDVIIHRLEMHEKTFLPVVEYYETNNRVITIDGSGTKDEVFAQLKDTLKGEYKKAR